MSNQKITQLSEELAEEVRKEVINEEITRLKKLVFETKSEILRMIIRIAKKEDATPEELKTLTEVASAINLRLS